MGVSWEGQGRIRRRAGRVGFRFPGDGDFRFISGTGRRVLGGPCHLLTPGGPFGVTFLTLLYELIWISMHTSTQKNTQIRTTTINPI